MNNLLLGFILWASGSIFFLLLVIGGNKLPGRRDNTDDIDDPPEIRLMWRILPFLLLVVVLHTVWDYLT